MKRKNKHRPKFRTGKRRRNTEGGAKQIIIPVFAFFFLMLSEEAASSKRQTGFMSLPVVSNNRSSFFSLSTSLSCGIQTLSIIISDRGFL